MPPAANFFEKKFDKKLSKIIQDIDLVTIL